MRLGILGTWFCLLSFGCLLASPSNLNRFFAEPGDFSKYDSTLDKELDRAENNGRIKKHWGQSVSSGLALECPHYGEVSAADHVKIGRDCLACGQKCCSRNADKRLYYGRDSYTNEFPWFVAVFVDGRFECGGVMVSPNSAVTAAHCVHKFCPRSNLRYSRRITVKVGSLNLNLDERIGPGSSHHIVEQVICNHYYRSGSNYRNDAAILRLEDHQRFPFVCLNNFTSEHPITRNCLAVGHGFTHKSN
uniref:Peptidase S1 domain-containing protein n=2 Tax=Ciona intestinalis TaxID=7719 RepID=F6VBG0_CIOIN